jgi:hypothetical protein
LDILNEAMSKPLGELAETKELPDGVYVIRVEKYEGAVNVNGKPYVTLRCAPVAVEEVEGLTQEELEMGDWWPVRGQMYISDAAAEITQKQLEQVLGAEGENFAEQFENALGQEARVVIGRNDRGYLEIKKWLRPKKDVQ